MQRKHAKHFRLTMREAFNSTEPRKFHLDVAEALTYQLARFSLRGPNKERPSHGQCVTVRRVYNADTRIWMNTKPLCICEEALTTPSIASGPRILTPNRASGISTLGPFRLEPSRPTDLWWLGMITIPPAASGPGTTSETHIAFSYTPGTGCRRQWASVFRGLGNRTAPVNGDIWKKEEFRRVSHPEITIRILALNEGHLIRTTDYEGEKVSDPCASRDVF